SEQFRSAPRTCRLQPEAREMQAAARKLGLHRFMLHPKQLADFTTISDTSTRARGCMGGRGLPRPGCEAEELARFRYRGDLAAEVLNDAHGLLDERGVAGCRFAPGEVHRVLHADAAVATKDEGLRQHGEGMPSGTEARPLARLRQHRLD